VKNKEGLKSAKEYVIDAFVSIANGKNGELAQIQMKPFPFCQESDEKAIEFASNAAFKDIESFGVLKAKYVVHDGQGTVVAKIDLNPGEKMPEPRTVVIFYDLTYYHVATDIYKTGNSRAAYEAAWDHVTQCRNCPHLLNAKKGECPCKKCKKNISIEACKIKNMYREPRVNKSVQAN